MKEYSYRPDIDGLRAIAVAAVVLYHFNIPFIDGGFVGVDVFFVISGYLITGIIYKELIAGEFTFAKFYERRIRRIFPALFLMLLVTIAVGFFVLLPHDLIKLGQVVIATLVYVSNIYLWRQSGYFDTSSEYNPLLHTWSLAVEEQFYIFFPVLLIVLHKVAKRRMKHVVLIAAVISFCLCVWMQNIRPSATFYLLPFRSWELLVGSLLALGMLPKIQNQIIRNTLSVVSLGLLIWSTYWMKAGPHFPGWQAIIPVISTAILIYTGTSGDTVVKRILSLQPIVFIGLISYSLYLWHWPVVVYAKYSRGMEELPVGITIFLIIFTVFISYLSQRWVEGPMRQRKTLTNKKSIGDVFKYSAIAAVCLIIVAAATRIDNGWSFRYGSEVLALDAIRGANIPYQMCDGKIPKESDSKCEFGVNNSVAKVMLWGDSHALAWAPAMNTIANERNLSGRVAIHSACPPAIGVINPASLSCTEFNAKTYAFIKNQHYDVIYMVASWLSYTNSPGQYTLSDVNGAVGNDNVFEYNFRNTLELVRPHTNKLVIIGPTPFAPSDIPFKMAVAKQNNNPLPDLKSRKEFELASNNFWKIATKLKYEYDIEVINPIDWFCDDNQCKYWNEKYGLLYRDGGHLSLGGAKFVVENFKW